MICLQQATAHCMPEPPMPKNFENKLNWCWMVSTLHCLYRMPTFKKIFDEKLYENHQADDFRLTLLQVFNDMKDQRRVDPNNLYDELVCKKIPSFTPIRGQANTEKNFYTGLVNLVYPNDNARKRYYFGCTTYYNYEDVPCELHENIVLIATQLNDAYSSIQSMFNGLSTPNKYGDYLKSAGDVVCIEIAENFNKEIKIEESINILNNNYKCVAMTGGKSHAVAIVKYESKWFVFDDVSFPQEPKELTFGEKNNLLNQGQFQGKCPNLIFYQKINLSQSPLQKKLTQLKNNLESLHDKLNSLSKRLKKLKNKLK